MIKLDRRRDVLAMNLTYAEQRALEIGITIAGGAERDPARRAHRRHEPQRDRALRRADPRGHGGQDAADGGARHGRGVRPGRQDRGAGLRRGDRLRHARERCAPMPAVQEAYLGSVLAERRPPKPDIEHAQARRPPRLLRQEPRAARRALRGAAGRDRRAARAQRLGPLDHRQGHHGPGRRHGLGALAGAARSWATRPSRSPSLGIGYVPENRDIFPDAHRAPEPAARRKARRQDAALVASTTCTRCSRA